MLTLTLIYPDGSHFIVGAFADQASINAWLETESGKPSWQEGTTTKVDERPAANPIPDEPLPDSSTG